MDVPQTPGTPRKTPTRASSKRSLKTAAAGQTSESLRRKAASGDTASRVVSETKTTETKNNKAKTTSTATSARVSAKLADPLAADAAKISARQLRSKRVSPPGDMGRALGETMSGPASAEAKPKAKSAAAGRKSLASEEATAGSLSAGAKPRRTGTKTAEVTVSKPRKAAVPKSKTGPSIAQTEVVERVSDSDTPEPGVGRPYREGPELRAKAQETITRLSGGPKTFVGGAPSDLDERSARAEDTAPEGAKRPRGFVMMAAAAVGLALMKVFGGKAGR